MKRYLESIFLYNFIYIFLRINDYLQPIQLINITNKFWLIAQIINSQPINIKQCQPRVIHVGTYVSIVSIQRR